MNQLGQIINNQLIKVIRPVLHKDAKVLEVGCVPGGRLNFLRRHFSIDPYGIDFYRTGLVKSEKRNISLVCADLFSNPFPSESFDLVYSLGVVEHFDPPDEAIIQHIELTKKDGIIMITIPNFNSSSITSMAYRLGRRYSELIKTHNMKIMELNEFRRLFDKISDVEPIIIDYYGPPMILSPPKYLFRAVADKLNRAIDIMSLRSKILSPDIVFVGRKK